MLQIKNVNLNVGNTALLSNINLTLSQRKEAADHYPDFVETEPPSYKGA